MWQHVGKCMHYAFRNTHTYLLESWVGVQLDACAILEWLRRFPQRTTSCAFGMERGATPPDSWSW